ncbi:sugar transferase [Natronoarchaeum philippinense]|uniref:sugar transferase n=1 Tax=Natronoarchaeum philippinense TaxID=558529 RepID=UPI002872CC4A|nr:sugar transferase [Natronoarchaeum philippinense]
MTGALLLTVGAVFVSNTPALQELATASVPLMSRFSPVSQNGVPFVQTLSLTALVVLASLLPLYRPRPRRSLDTVSISLKRVVVAGLALATVGFFDWVSGIPRTTLLLTVSALSVAIPAWFVWIHRWPHGDAERVLIVGDDPNQISTLSAETSLPLLGYLSPTSVFASGDGTATENVTASKAIADGGVEDLERLGGLSRLEDALVDLDIDTVVLAFHEPDRAECFGVLDTCHEYGVTAKVHREFADTILTEEDAVGTLADVELEPWNAQDYLFKRVFDIAFAGTALVVLSPMIGLIILAINFEGEGPVFFNQERTCLYGNTFTVRKFRTLKPVDDDVDLDIDQDRRTPLGEFLRTTHFDEIPQLWSILVGDMSVVGPRPAITELEPEYEAEADAWRQRWFVKPGLTGRAQINDATGHEPKKKLQHDLQYVRNQSFFYDLRIVVRQISKVVADLVSFGGSN